MSILTALPEAPQKLFLLSSHRECLQIENDVCCIAHPKAVCGRTVALPLVLDGLLHAPVCVSLEASQVSTFNDCVQAYALTLLMGTILNFSAGGFVRTNVALTGTLTSAQVVSTPLHLHVLSRRESSPIDLCKLCLMPSQAVFSRSGYHRSQMLQVFMPA